MAEGFALLLENLMEMNFGLFLVWLVVLAIVYGVLNKTEAFGSDNTVNGIISLAVAFLAVFGVYQFIPETIFTSAMGYTAVGLILLLVFVVILGMIGFTPRDMVDTLGDNYAILALLVGAAIIAAIGFFAFPGGTGDLFEGINLQSAATTISIAILMFWILKWLLTNGGGD